MKLLVTADEIVNQGLWKLFPAIEVSKAKDIPCDYPGAMGIPITAMSKIQRNDGKSGVIIIDNLRPEIDGKPKYQRLIIRNLKPELPKQDIDFGEMLEKAGVNLIIELSVEGA